MKNPPSSSPADRRTRIACIAGLAAGPVLVVVASFASAWLAVASDDGIVAQNYYRRGLLINRTLHANDDAAHEVLVGAEIAVAPSGAVSVHVDGAPHARELVLVISRPGGTETVRLTETGAGSYEGRMHDVEEGRRVVTLRGDGWQLPTTVTNSLRRVRLAPATPLRIS